MKQLVTLLAVCVATQSVAKVNDQPFAYRFRENKGQVHNQHHQPRADVLYTAQYGRLAFQLKRNGVSYQLNRVDKWKEVPAKKFKGEKRTAVQTTFYRVDIDWVNTNPTASVVAVNASSDYERFYYPGCNGEMVRSYGDVFVKNIYAGIDLHYYSKNAQLKYDYIVAPHSQYKNIRLKVRGATHMALQSNGALILHTPLGNIEEGAPIVYQLGKRLQAQWVIENNELSFDVRGYNPAFEMTIDPLTKIWGTYYGGSGNDGLYIVKEDAAGNVYACGGTASTVNIATSGAFQTTYGGGYSDALLVKFSPTGQRLWATYAGGGGSSDYAGYIDLDPSGNVFLCGATEDATSSNTVLASAGAHQGTCAAGTDAFLLKFDPLGNRLWGTYYGGDGYEWGECCAADRLGNVYLCGETDTFTSTTIATTGAHQTTVSAGSSYLSFLVKFNAAGVRQWGTYYGDTPNGDIPWACATDASNNVYMAGSTTTSVSAIMSTSAAMQPSIASYGDGFLVKFNPAGVRVWGTYYGDSSGYTEIYGLAIDKKRNIYVAGQTSGTLAALTTPGCHQPANAGGLCDGFVARFDSLGNRVWGTFYGGNSWDYVLCSVNPQGDVLLTGSTQSGSGIATPQSYQPAINGAYDAFIAKLTSAGVRLWGTYVGGSNNDFSGNCAANAAGMIYLGGSTNSGSGVATPGTHQTTFSGGYDDGQLLKFYDCTPLNPVNQTVPQNYCEGKSFTLAVAGSTATTNWYSTPASTTSIASGSTYLTPTLSPGTYTYYVQASAASCSLSSQRTPLQFSVWPTPTLQAAGSAATLCAGQHLTLTASGASTYTWLPSGSGGTLLVTPTVNVTYTLTGNTVFGCTNSAVYAVTVQAQPVLQLSAGATSICAGESTTLGVSGAASYTWSNGQNSSGISVSPSVSTSYSVMGASPEGCTAGGSILLAVDACAGLAQQAVNAEPGLFPNPFKDEVYLRGESQYTLCIYDACGRLVKQKTLTAGAIPLHELSKGIYLVYLFSEQTQRGYAQKLVKD